MPEAGSLVVRQRHMLKNVWHENTNRSLDGVITTTNVHDVGIESSRANRVGIEMHGVVAIKRPFDNWPLRKVGRADPCLDRQSIARSHIERGRGKDADMVARTVEAKGLSNLTRAEAGVDKSAVVVTGNIPSIPISGPPTHQARRCGNTIGLS